LRHAGIGFRRLTGVEPVEKILRGRVVAAGGTEVASLLKAPSMDCWVTKGLTVLTGEIEMELTEMDDRVVEGTEATVEDGREDKSRPDITESKRGAALTRSPGALRLLLCMMTMHGRARWRRGGDEGAVIR